MLDSSEGILIPTEIEDEAMVKYRGKRWEKPAKSGNGHRGAPL